MAYDTIIGIDTGTKTGYAEYNKKTKNFDCISTLTIDDAMFRIRAMHENGKSIYVVVEDARQAKFGRRHNSAQAQGAGSIKRDASIWETFLKRHNIPYLMKRPNKALTKWPVAYFQKTTGFMGRTSEHARDAAVMIFGM